MAREDTSLYLVTVMPLYEYLCHKCGKKFDALQKFSDEPLKIHEEDGGEVERLISSPAFHFKGTGWYVTDYAKSNGVSTPAGEKNGEKSGEKSSESSGDKSGESKSESKPAESKTESSPQPAPAANSASTDK